MALFRFLCMYGADLQFSCQVTALSNNRMWLVYPMDLYTRILWEDDFQERMFYLTKR